MQKSALEILKKIEDHGFEAFIVGGFVRDYYMGIKSLDVDICTNATPKELSNIFEGAIIPTETYGAVTLIYKKVRYEITTYRMERKYDDYRRPMEVEYVNDLTQDIKRRDFTVNTLCMNSEGEIIDLLEGIDDINNKIIRTVGNPEIKLNEDVLRILRAVRFATTLNFTLADDVKKAIIENGALLKKLSYDRKKEELVKIFTSPNVNYGISLLINLKLDKHLDLSNLSTLKVVDDILGIWAQLDVLDVYPFNNAERDTITKVKEVLDMPRIDNYTIYHYGLYVMTIVASIKGMNKKDLIASYTQLPIKSRNDIELDVPLLCKQLGIAPSYWLKELYDILEQKIINGNLINNKMDVHNYAIEHLKAILAK